MDSIQTMEQRKCLQVKISLKCVSRETLVYGSTIGWCLPNPLKYKKKIIVIHVKPVCSVISLFL